MRLLHRVNPWAIAILAIATYSLAAGSAFGLSTGNGGGQPPAQYNSPLPTLNSGQGSYEQSDNRGRIIVSPSSFPSIQPVSIPTPAQYNSTLHYCAIHAFSSFTVAGYGAANGKSQ